MFRSVRTSVAAVAVVAAVSALAAGCSVASAGAGAPEKTSIVVDDFPTIDSAGLFIAQMDGLFRQQGLNVTIRFAPANQLAVSSVVNGTSDISVADYVTYIDTELNDNARLRIIDEASALQPNVLELLANSKSPIKSLAELRGHTVGVTEVGDISTLLVDALMSEQGITTDDQGIEGGSVALQQGFPLQNVARQVADGAADAAAIPEPFASEGKQDYGLQELADIDQGVTRNFPLDGYAVTQAFARKNPNTLAAFNRALEQGQQIADSNRSAVEAAIVKFLGVSPQTAAMVSLPDYPLSVNATQLQRVVDTMVQFRLLPSSDMHFNITRMTR